MSERPHRRWPRILYADWILALVIMLAAPGCSGVAGESSPDATSVAAVIRASASSARTSSVPLDGATLQGEAYVFLSSPDEVVERVAFYLDQDTDAEGPLSVAEEAPFELTASEEDRDGPWNTRTLSDGRHRLRAEVHMRRGTVHVVRADFQVANGGEEEDPAEPEPENEAAEPPSDTAPGSEPEAEPKETGPEPDQPEPAPESDEPEPDPKPAPEPEEPADDGDTGTGIWRPSPGTSWQWQLQGTIDTSVQADVFDIDLFDTSRETIAELQDRGRKVICYFSAGSYEPWRPDVHLFPEEVLGKKMAGWDEKWLDVRRIELLSPVVLGRLDLAAEKGCDAVEPDNVDGDANDTGFDLGYEDQIRYNTFLAEEAHARGLAIGLKNDLEQIPDLVDSFDFAVNEECYQWNECGKLTPFVEAGKAVFGAEYEASTEEFCPVTTALNFDFIRKRLELDAYRESCR